MMDPKYELYSMTENLVYSEDNATIANIGGIFVLASPKTKEPLVLRLR